MLDDNQLIIFSDLDGSLLDHQTYDWDAASEALLKIKHENIPLVLCSSKTYDEILSLVTALKLCHPFIFENGCGVAIPEAYFDIESPCGENCSYSIQFLSSKLDFIHNTLAKINETGQYHYELFSTLGEQRISELTGLTPTQAALAIKRNCSEPLIWHDSSLALVEFKNHLKQYGMRLLSGGRFHTVTELSDKGRAINWLMARYQTLYPDANFSTMGLGDSANDIQMFHAVSVPSLIKNPHIDQDNIEGLKGFTKTELAGPAGWNNAVLEFIRVNRGADNG